MQAEPRRCPRCMALSALAFGLFAWWVMDHSAASTQVLRAKTEATGQAALQATGHGWAKIRIDDRTAWLEGQAPSPEARTQALEQARSALEPSIGWPGVIAEVKDASISAEQPAPTAPAAMAAVDCSETFAKVLQSESIRFSTGGAEISPESAQLLTQLAAVASRCSAHAMVIEGHTDNRGSAESNLALSERRANAVLFALRERGIPTDRMNAKGFGETQAMDPADTPAAWAKNRRIEFKLQSKP